MTQFYFDPERANDPHAMPDGETFYRTEAQNLEYVTLDGDGKPMPTGWYYWTCLPGCVPESEPNGPFDSESKAITAAQEDYYA